jgi:hypothetical protein
VVVHPVTTSSLSKIRIVECDKASQSLRDLAVSFLFVQGPKWPALGIPDVGTRCAKFLIEFVAIWQHNARLMSEILGGTVSKSQIK